MNARIKISMIAALMIAICLVPALSDESDGVSDIRVSDRYVFVATFDYVPSGGMSSSGNSLVMIDGSSNDQLMQRYLDDPDNPAIQIKTDDRAAIIRTTSTVTVNVYYFGYSEYDSSIWFDSQEKTGKLLLRPYNMDALTFFVKAGDEFSLTIDAQDNEGNDTSMRLSSPSFTEYIENGRFSETFKNSTSLVVSFDNNALYFEVSYDVSGNSTPNGSATVFFAVCAGITAIILAILIIAGFKPKWSK